MSAIVDRRVIGPDGNDKRPQLLDLDLGVTTREPEPEADPGGTRGE